MKGQSEINLQLGKPLIIYDIKEIHQNLLKNKKNCNKLIIDLKNLDDCDTSGIQLLYSLYKTMKKEQKKFVILNTPKIIEDNINQLGVVSQDFINLFKGS